MLKFSVALIFISFFNISFSQTDSIKSNKKEKTDTLYVSDMSKKLSLRIVNIIKRSDLTLTNKETGKYLVLSPNGQVNIGVGINYKWLALIIAFKMPYSNNDNDIYGETSRLDMQLNLYQRNYGIDFHFQKYTGFYISNAQQYIDTAFTIYPQLPNMKLYSAGISGYYFFNNKKFSYRAAYIRNEIQKKGQGSMVLGSYYNLNVANNDQGFGVEVIPDSVHTNLNISHILSKSYGVNFGYTYTFIIAKKLFLNLSLTPGLGIVSSNIKSQNELLKLKPILATNYIGRMAIGYEKNKYYFGITAFIAGSAYDYEYLKIQPSTSNVKIFFGKRFWNLSN